MLNIRDLLIYVSTSIIDGEAPGILRALLIEDESTWSSDKTWWSNPKISGLERHLDGRRQAISVPPRTNSITNYPRKFSERLERKIFGEDVSLRLKDEYPNYFLEVRFGDKTYHSQVFEDTNLVDLYNELKEYHSNLQS